MSFLNYNNFYGVWPRYHKGDLPPGYAEVAENVDLRHGTLKPWRVPKRLTNVGANAQSFFNYRCCWYGWYECVHVARWIADCPRLYISGRKPYLEVALVGDVVPPDCDGFSPQPPWCDSDIGALHCDLRHYRVGFPELPTNVDAFILKGRNAPVLQRSQKSEWWSYCCTYENEFGEESGPSYPSQPIEILDPEALHAVDDIIGTSYFTGVRRDLPPEAFNTSLYGRLKLKYYRSMTGFYTGQEGAQDNRTDWFYCGEEILYQGNTWWPDFGGLINPYDPYNPNWRRTPVLAAGVGEKLSTSGVENPPEGLRGVQAISTTKELVGYYDGNKVRFSINAMPWNWPISQELALDENIVDLKESAGIVYVMTSGFPYVIQGTGECTELSCRTVLKHGYPFPAIAGSSGAGSVATPWGVVYVSTDGLVALSGTTTPKVMTDLWFSADDWRKLRPETMRLAYYQGAIFCVSDVYAFILFTDQATYSKWDTYVLSTISNRPRRMLTTTMGELMFLAQNGDVYQWNAGDSYQPYFWKGRIEYTSDYQHFGVCRVRCDGSALMTLYASERPVFTRKTPGEQVFRIPKYGHHLLHAASFAGTGQVWYAQFATNRRDLNVRD